MNVVAINSSPWTDKGNTSLILTPFLDGMREAGAEVDLFYTKKLDVKPCQGEYHCWFKTPGVCFQKDDMQMVLPKFKAADIWVFATPLYCDGVTGPMKNFMDRLIPGVQPFIELRDDHCRHPAAADRATGGKLALVSNCGFWELDNFDAMLVHMRAFCKNLNYDFAGALLRPHGGGLRDMHKAGMPLDDIFDAAKEAGRQLVEEGAMSSDTLDIVSRELMPRDMYLAGANQSFQERLDAGAEKVPAEGAVS